MVESVALPVILSPWHSISIAIAKRAWKYSRWTKRETIVDQVRSLSLSNCQLQIYHHFHTYLRVLLIVVHLWKRVKSSVTRTRSLRTFYIPSNIALTVLFLLCFACACGQRKEKVNIVTSCHDSVEHTSELTNQTRKFEVMQTISQRTNSNGRSA